MKHTIITEHTCGETTCYSTASKKMCKFVVGNARGQCACSVLNEKLEEDEVGFLLRRPQCLAGKMIKPGNLAISISRRD
jgi:hypothetical protein